MVRDWQNSDTDWEMFADSGSCGSCTSRPVDSTCIWQTRSLNQAVLGVRCELESWSCRTVGAARRVSGQRKGEGRSYPPVRSRESGCAAARHEVMSPSSTYCAVHIWATSQGSPGTILCECDQHIPRYVLYSSCWGRLLKPTAERTAEVLFSYLVYEYDSPLDLLLHYNN